MDKNIKLIIVQLFASYIIMYLSYLYLPHDDRLLSLLMMIFTINIYLGFKNKEYLVMKSERIAGLRFIFLLIIMYVVITKLHDKIYSPILMPNCIIPLEILFMLVLNKFEKK